MKFHFLHENFNVLDLEKSIKFYEEALGLKVEREKFAEDGSYKIVYRSIMDTGCFHIVKVYITIICLLGNAVDFSHRNLFSSVTAKNHTDSLINKEYDH